MKIIFLDIDGVLNSEQFFVSQEEKGIEETFPLGHLDEKAIEILNEIIEITGAKIVVSSVWRLGRTVEELQSLLNQKGLWGQIIDFTPRGCTKCLRGNEIREWMQKNEEKLKVKSFVIIDDDSDMLLWQKDNFVHTSSKVGLTAQDAIKAITILGESNVSTETRV